MNLRAPLRASLSISDVSEKGVGAAESEVFAPSFSKIFGEEALEDKSALDEQRVRRLVGATSLCAATLTTGYSARGGARGYIMPFCCWSCSSWT